MGVGSDLGIPGHAPLVGLARYRVGCGLDTRVHFGLDMAFPSVD